MLGNTHITDRGLLSPGELIRTRQSAAPSTRQLDPLGPTKSSAALGLPWRVFPGSRQPQPGAAVFDDDAMKPHRSPFPLLVLWGALALALTGCATPAAPLGLVPVLQTNIVERWQTNITSVTNIVTVTVPGAAAPVLATNITPVISVLNLPPITVITTNAWAVAPPTTALIGTVGAVANVAAPGTGTLASGALTLLAAGWAAFNTWRARRNEGGAAALVKGIESFRTGLAGTSVGQQLDTHLLGALQDATAAAGVAPYVDALVEQHTVPSVAAAVAAALNAGKPAASAPPSTLN